MRYYIGFVNGSVVDSKVGRLQGLIDARRPYKLAGHHDSRDSIGKGRLFDIV